jgi:hypothetical protein
METSNMDQTASSPHSQASIPPPTLQGHSPLPTTLGKGCRANPPLGSTHLPRSTWGSITSQNSLMDKTTRSPEAATVTTAKGMSTGLPGRFLWQITLTRLFQGTPRPP